MKTDDLESICRRAIENGATDARAIHPGAVVTAPWVRFKCQFGCPVYGQSYCCPPDTPDHRQTREMLDSYELAVLVNGRFENSPDRRKATLKFYQKLVDLEGEIFKEGFYKAFVFLAGPCRVCASCEKLEGEPCANGYLSRPSMEGCGIDVYQTARNAGFTIHPLSERSETRNFFCLLLVD